MSTATLVRHAVEEGRMSGRLWVYANYNCNITCTYCLTESGPKVPRREVGEDRIREIARQAAALGFTELGITGGEPFLLRYLPEVLLEATDLLPVVVLSNATLFTDRLIDRLRPLVGRPLRIQISLDRPDPIDNDEMRGPENFAKVTEAIPRLIAAGLHVRIASTLPYEEASGDPTPDMLRLCALHRDLGVSDDDHLIRPIVARGRAALEGLGVTATRDDLEPELTITADGAFWNPFAPTVAGGRLATDLMVSRTTLPLEKPVSALLRVVEGRPPGHDATLGIQ